ncbi:MAG: hypothetical protein ACREAR_04495 [Nitrosotalea sp.]
MKSLHLTIIISITLAFLLSFAIIPRVGHASFEGGSRDSMVLGTDQGEIQMPQNKCTQNPQFGPGPHPAFTGGPIHWPWPSSDNITGFGFSKTVQVYDKGDEIDNFVLEPGHSAQIAYSLFVKSDFFNPRNLAWIQNDAGFMHRTSDAVIPQKISDMGNTTLDNGTSKKTWYVCQSIPGGATGCGPQYGTRPPSTVSLPTIVYDHPGISVSYFPPFELVGIIPITVTATITASNNASEGTYWMYLAPGPNDGGPEVLLTVGKCLK